MLSLLERLPTGKRLRSSLVVLLAFPFKLVFGLEQQRIQASIHCQIVMSTIEFDEVYAILNDLIWYSP